MQANLITLIRVALVFLVIGLYEFDTLTTAVAVVLTILVLFLSAY